MLCTLARTDTQPSACGEPRHVCYRMCQSTACCCKSCVWCAEPTSVLHEKNPPARPEKAILGPKWPSRDRGVWAVSCVMGPCLGPSHTFVRSVQKGCALSEQRSVC